MHFRSIKVWSAVVVGIGVLTLALILSLTVGSPMETKLIAPAKFDGIAPLEKRTTSLVIIHGIGHHCIGYADELITNLFKDLTERNPESIRQSYGRYLQQTVADSGVTHSADGAYWVETINMLRDGSCQVIEDFDYGVDREKLNRDEDMESVVLAQDDLCRSIHTNESSNEVDVSCHKLYVNREHTVYKDENPEYVTGFIRRFSTDLTAERRLRIYEVTWSPATRWIKQSLMNVDQFNSRESDHRLNRMVKKEIVNGGIADAVAYMADSGILVNYDVMQAFCLTFANAKSLHKDYAFACDRSHLIQPAGDFSKENDVYVVSHSLGTRVLFDSIGMLAQGTVGSIRPDESVPTLVSTIAEKFQRIGAAVPEEYLSVSDPEPTFISALNRQIPEFAKALQSIYVFTNQVPLLAANLTSPFQGSNDVGTGFQQFLELRDPKGSRLQVVSFHDPDDVLSYNLRCWYYQTVLKKLDDTKKVLENEAMARAVKKGTDIGDEQRKLRNTLFADNCSEKNLGIEDRSLFSQIWDVQKNRIKLVNAAIRLKGFRLKWIAADPMDVHSNYFVDKTVHGWLANGN